MATTTRCSNCGRDASGNFCGSCGAALEGAPCPECNARLEPGALFCASCSHDLRVPRRSRMYWPLVAALAVAGIAVILVAVRMDPGPKSTHPTVPILPPRTAQTAQPLRPLQEADQFFDRAMRAYEGGDSAQARFAGRMALEAYASLNDLDADARFHVGLLHEITGDYDAMLAQADSIELTNPNHLFPPMLRHRVAVARGDYEGAQDAYRQFLARYDAEMAQKRPEYELHRNLIESFRREAGGPDGS
jgi:hypothetical protein